MTPEPDRLECIIFDLDGLLVDSEPLQFQSYVQAFRQFGVTLDMDGWVDWHTAEASVKRWIQSLGLDLDAEEVRDAKKAIYDQIIDEQMALKPGAKFIVDELVGRYRLAVASGSRPESIRRCLDKFSMTDCFELLVSGTEVVRSKPYPDVYTEVLRRLGTCARNSIALEDSPAGLRAANAAGIKCIVCPDSFMPRHDSAFDQASLVVDSLNEIDRAVLEHVHQSG